jgi:hypothetical protein
MNDAFAKPADTNIIQFNLPPGSTVDVLNNVITAASPITGSVSVVGPAGQSPRIKIRTDPGSLAQFIGVNLDDTGFMEFKNLDFADLGFGATGKGTLRFTDCSLQADRTVVTSGSAIYMFGLSKTLVADLQLTLERVSFDGFNTIDLDSPPAFLFASDLDSYAGGAIYMDKATVTATGACVIAAARVERVACGTRARVAQESEGLELHVRALAAPAAASIMPKPRVAAQQ